MASEVPSPNHNFQRYLRSLTATVVLALAAVAMFNWWVDPYRLFSQTPRSQLTSMKARPGSDLAGVKLLNAIAFRPDVLILGNSRADVGFDPQHPALQALGSRVYNLAVPGQGIGGALANFTTLLKSADVRAILVGVDFLDFAVNAHPSDAYREPEASDVRIQLGQKRLRALFTFAGTTDSIRTLLAAHERFPETIRADGFNPMLDYIAVAEKTGPRAMFEQRFEETRKRLMQARLGLYPAGQADSAEMASLRQLLSLAADRKVRVVLVTYPYHADYLMLFRQVGIWDDFEQWKREIVAVAADSSIGNPDAPASVIWDFAALSEFTTQPVPSDSTPGAARWYWEGGHFKKELGDILLATALPLAPADGASPVCGAKLTDETLDDWLRRQRLVAERHWQSKAARPGPDFLCCPNPQAAAVKAKK
jgi:hypothetical protein